VTRAILEKDLQKVIEKSEHWNVGFAGVPVHHLEEIVHHSTTAFTRSRHFYGRQTLVQTALERIQSTEVSQKKTTTNITTTTNENQLFPNISLALIGRSGCGKTALMSKLALSCIDPTGEIPTIIRFCGTSQFSLNGLKLIQSICIQILAARGMSTELRNLIVAAPTQDYKTGVEYFHKLTAQYPVSLFIDSLDQLDNRNEERSKLTFLRGIQAHKRSRSVVSCLPDEYDAHGGPGKYFYECERTLKAAQVPLLEVGKIENVELVIKELLHSRRRKLTYLQHEITIGAIHEEPTILYINLAMEVVTKWRSFDHKESQLILTPTVKGLIGQIFDDLEKTYGKVFVSIAFAMISFSREGVNDPEMQDLLTLHDGAMAEVCQYCVLHCYPMHAWLRLKYVIKYLVAEKETRCIRWGHRQLWETAKERYDGKKKECHQIMGKYFANLCDRRLKIEKDILDQTLTLNKLPVWQPESTINRRRVIEGYYHLIMGGLLHEAVNEVCSLKFVCCSALSGDSSTCLRYLGELVHQFGNAVPPRFDHYYRWLKRRATSIVAAPRLHVRLTAGEEPAVSEVHKDAANLYRTERNELGRTFGPMTFGAMEHFDAVEMELTGDSISVSSMAWNPKGTEIGCGSGNNFVIWDATTGELLKTLEGHSDNINSAAWNDDGSKIITGSSDGMIKIWDGINGEPLKTVKDHLESVESLTWNHNGTKFASGSSDKTIKIWDAISGKLLNTLEGHSRQVLSVSWNHDGTKLASGSWDKTVNIWEEKTGKLLTTFTGHSEGVSSVAWHRDGKKIASGSFDWTVKVWDELTGTILMEHNCGSSVNSMAWNHDGTKIVAGLLSRNILIWEINKKDGKTTIFTDNHSDPEKGVKAVAWNQSGTKIASGSGRISDQSTKIRIWNVSALERQKVEEHTTRETAMAWNHDGTLLLCGSLDGTVKLWDDEKGELLKTWKGHSQCVKAVAWNHDSSRSISASSDKTIKIWEGMTGELLKTLIGHSDVVESVAWNHDGSRIVSASQDHTIKIWDDRSGSPITPGLSASPSRISASSSKGVLLANNLDESSMTLKQEALVLTVAWNHDGTKIASGSNDGAVKIWNGSTGTLLNTLLGHSDLVQAVAWSHDGTKIVSGSWDTKVIIWDALTGNHLRTLEGHSSQVISVGWNNEGTTLVSASKDKTIRIWSGLSGKPLTTLGFLTEVSCAAYNRDGSKLAFCCSDSFSRIWCDPSSTFLGK
jgi:WD40 repeat protein